MEGLIILNVGNRCAHRDLLQRHGGVGHERNNPPPTPAERGPRSKHRPPAAEYLLRVASYLREITSCVVNVLNHAVCALVIIRQLQANQYMHLQPVTVKHGKMMFITLLTYSVFLLIYVYSNGPFKMAPFSRPNSVYACPPAA